MMKYVTIPILPSGRPSYRCVCPFSWVVGVASGGVWHRGTWRPAALTLAPIEFVVTRASTVQCFRPGGEYR